MKSFLGVLFFLLLLVLPSCFNSDRELILLKVSEIGPAKISDSSLVVILQEELKRKIRIEYTLSEDTALKMLENRKVDLAIIPNNMEGTCKDSRKLRTVAPLLPRILVILTNNIEGTEEMSVKDLFENQVVVFEEMSRLDSIFFKTFFQSYGIEQKKPLTYLAHQIDVEKWADSSFVYVGLTHLHNPIMQKLVGHGACFFPLDDVDKLGKGSSVEGLHMVFPKLSPFILPKSFILGKPVEPVLTISISDVMVTCKDMDNYVVYDIVKAITEKRPELINSDNIYNLLDTKMNDYVFSFPLHSGAISYLNRDKPSVWTRYASVIWPFISILAIIAGALASLSRHLHQRKRVRIDLIYTELLKVRKKAFNNQNDSSREQLLKEIRDIRSKAFDALMENKLSANVSFTIFLSLYSEVMDEIMKMDKQSD